MNIFKYINSKSIAKYLAETDYKFNALEAAYLVWQCKSVSLADKFAAWREIIETMPDMSVKKRRWGWNVDEPSVHAFLKKYINFVQEDIGKFYRADGAVYTFSVLYESDFEWCKDDRVFTSLKLCEEALKEEITDGDHELYSIKQLTPDKDEYIEGVFLKNGDICDIYAVQPDNTDEIKAEYMLRFEGLWFAFPTPFKRGDIVYQPNRYERNPDPFVLLDMSTWGEKELRENGYTDGKKIAGLDRIFKMHKADGDETDMHVSGLFIDNYGRVYQEHTLDSYLNLEYYGGELNAEHKFLTALSNYEKGKIDIALLANAYKLLTDEVRDKNIRRYAYFTEDDLKYTGLK